MNSLFLSMLLLALCLPTHAKVCSDATSWKLDDFNYLNSGSIIRLSQDNKVLIAIGLERVKTYKLDENNKPSELASVKLDKDSWRYPSVSPNATLVRFLDSDGMYHLYRLTKNGYKKVLTIKDGRIIELTDDNKVVITKDGVITVYKVEESGPQLIDQVEYNPLNRGTRLLEPQLTSDGKMLLVPALAEPVEDKRQLLRLYKIENDKLIQVDEVEAEFENLDNSPKFTADNKIIFVQDHLIKGYQIINDKIVKTNQIKFDGSLAEITFSKSNKYFVLRDTDNKKMKLYRFNKENLVFLDEVDAGSYVISGPDQYPFKEVKFSNDDSMVIIQDSVGREIFQIKNDKLKLITTLDKNTRFFDSAYAFSGDSSMVLNVKFRGNIHLYKIINSKASLVTKDRDGSPEIEPTDMIVTSNGLVVLLYNDGVVLAPICMLENNADVFYDAITIYF